MVKIKPIYNQHKHNLKQLKNYKVTLIGTIKIKIIILLLIKFLKR